MIQFRARQTVYGIALVCLALFCSTLIEINAQGNGNGTANNDTIPNTPSINSDPLADAGADETYTEGEEFFVDGSASSDPEGDELSYFWKQISPSSPVLDIKSEFINFYSKAPEVTDNRDFELELTVEDGKGGKDSDMVKITVMDNAEEPNSSLLSRPNSDHTIVNHKNDTLLPSTSALLPGSSLAGSKNDTLLPSTSEATDSSSTGNSNTLLPTIDELTSISEGDSVISDLGTFNVAAAGDYGCTNIAADTVKNIQSISSEVTLALGDFSYEDSANCWLELVKPIEKSLKLVQGNWDIIIPGLWNQYLSKFDPGKIDVDNYYYSFTENGIHFLIMDSEIPQLPKKSSEFTFEILSKMATERFQNLLNPSSDQYKFVKEDLEKASSNPETKWIIVSLHRPIYHAPAKGASDSIQVELEPILRKYYQPLFDLYGVDLVLQGHEHNYQRTYPVLFNSADINSPTKTTNEKHDYYNPTGVIYITAGTGGVERFKTIEPVDLSMVPEYIVSTNGEDNKKGFLELRFSEDDSKMEGTFHSNDGNTVDQFTISKNVDPSLGIFVPPS